ncbi:MAG: ABC transporter substrate-binding protein [Spirochaetales bacterium]|nr:ABC transporter substrate-binding protein [Spirochaetales bacterium]
MFNTRKYRSAPWRFMKVLSVSLLLFCSLAGLFAMPQQETPENSDSFVVTDMRGRSVSVPGEINGIVAIGAGSLRLLSYLDSTDKIIAVEDSGHGREKTVHNFFSLATYRLAFPGLRELPSIGSGENHEGIIAAAPDIIISSAVDVGQIDQLQNILGIPVFAVNVDVEFFDTELFYNQLEILGRLLDKEDRAQELVEGIKAIMKDFETRAEGIEETKRAYAGGMMYYGPADLLRTTGDYLPFDLTGTENIMPTNPAGNLQPYMTSLEDLIAAAPDYAFIDAANVNLSKAGFMTNRNVLEEQVPAFTNGEVYTTFVYKYYGTNWENQLINVYYIGTVLYPQLYSDIAINDKAEEIWNLFFGVSLNYNSVIDMQKAGPGRVDWFN